MRLAPVRPGGWWFDTLLLAGFVALTGALAAGHLLGLDLAVSEWAFTHDPTPLYWTARVFNLLGQGGWLLLPVSGALAVAVAWRRHTVRPLLLVAGAFLITTLTIGPLKLWTDRAAPTASVKEPFLAPEEAVEIFNQLPVGAYSMSYPSGHVANAIVWYGVIALLLACLTAGRLPVGPYRLVRYAPPAILLVTTTYLNFHWLTDGLAALLLGLLLDRLLHRVPWDDLPLPGRLRRWDRPFIQHP
ncbi:Membrane-associated phospholipid phosphatase [Micromonospora phaseoli]|uniref:Membrane-associated phospholipid phosphatase n=2 Tax=Micromonospora phaseoli TaxID=1144548 RepID=A0A1H7DT02_9ACTN|nr:membrane-associated phospholipid phosphatase [Micromonospora phaseoli]GIJ75645.1 phosphatidic acid phosphatase [Micromonospora phaseoli]SEK01425.1 Membrane-associated phospholipid phosphatase [Micromonospora phaseoli]